VRRLSVILVALGLLAGCGEEQAGSGAAQLWITRDRGSDVILSTSVPAGISAMEALRREADVETRYGGRFVHSINGMEGDVADRHDWFYFVNGYEADLSAADYRLHDGDVLWWDHRSWDGQMRQPVVVGAFPEPFLHGWGGERRPAVVRGPPGRLSRRLAELVDGTVNTDREGANELVLVDGSGFQARLAGSPGDPVRFELGRAVAERIARDPGLVRYRYEGVP
jgi:Domain of unknown function (DUF4430)